MAGRTLPAARDVAEAGYDALMRGVRVYVPGLSNKLTVQVPRLFPRNVVTRVVRMAQGRRKQG